MASKYHAIIWLCLISTFCTVESVNGNEIINASNRIEQVSKPTSICLGLEACTGIRNAVLRLNLVEAKTVEKCENFE